MRTRDVVLLVILVILLVIAGYFVWGKKAEYNIQPAGQEQSAGTAVSTSSAGAAATSTASSTAAQKTAKTTAKAPLSVTQKYLDALKVYKNAGYYFQFLNCHASPGTLTMKAGKKFMLDNKDNAVRSIKIVGGQSFRISAYNYAIATAPYKEGIYYVTCDGGGSAQIKVQL